MLCSHSVILEADSPLACLLDNKDFAAFKQQRLDFDDVVSVSRPAVRALSVTIVTLGLGENVW